MTTSVADSKRPSQAVLTTILTAVAIIAGLYFGQSMLVPFALALLLSFLLSSPVNWLEKLRCGRSFSVLVVMTVALVVSALLLWLGVDQLAGIVQSLPHYRRNMVNKLESLQNPAGHGLLNMMQTIESLKRDFSAEELKSERKGNPAPEEGTAGSTEAPVPVHVVNSGEGRLAYLGPAGSSLAGILAELMAIVVLTLFMLLNRGHLRNRALRLIGQGHLILMTTAIDDAAKRVSRYLLTQSLVNGSFGVLLWVGLSLIGVPYAPFWGVLVAVLRFLPYVGTFIAGLCPFILSLLVLEGWRRPLMTLALYLAIELTISMLLEPWLYATRTGISSLAILLSAAFWTLLWGPIGLVLSTPLTVCLAALGRYLPPLEFLYVLLGDEPVLTEEVRYYQRLLADDEDEAAQILETELKSKPLVRVYDSVVVAALALAERDRHEGRLPEVRAALVHQGTRELVEAVGERHPMACQVEGASFLPAINCIAARDEADAVVGTMLVQLLLQCGFRARLVESISDQPEGTIIVSALPPFAMMHARSICKRLRNRYPGVPIVLGVWGSLVSAETIRERLGATCADWVATSLEAALGQISSQSVPMMESEGRSR